MVKRSIKRLTKMNRNKSRSKRKSKKSQKTIGLVYYKMNRCKYCKMFESELWKELLNYCNKKGIKTHIVVRELNPELIPNKIRSFPSLVKYDKNYKMTIFKDKRNKKNLINFLK